MSLSLALSAALSGLRAAQGALAVISGNVANVNTVGYSRKTQSLSPDVAGGQGVGVATGSVLRQVDEFLRRDLRRETSTLGEASVRQAVMSRLQDMLGATADGSLIGQDLSDFAAALEAYAASPELAVNQSNVVDAAQTLTTGLNRAASQIQALRLDVAQDIGQAVDTVNSSLRDVERLNRQIARAAALGEPTGDLSDQRDLAASAIAEQMGIQTYLRSSGEMVIFTASGRTLVDGVAVQLDYSTPAALGTASAMPAITLGRPPADISAELGSGRLAALVEAGNTTLPGVTAQLNEIAKALYGNADRTTGVADPGLTTVEVTVTAGSFAPDDVVTAGSNTGVVTAVDDLGGGAVRLTIRATAGSFAAGDVLANGLGDTGTVDAVGSDDPFGALLTGSGSPSAIQRTLDLRGLTTAPVAGQTISDGTTTATISGVSWDPATGSARVAVSSAAGPGFALTAPPTAIGIGGPPAAGAAETLIGINDSGRFFANVDLTASGAVDNAATIRVHPDLVADQGGDSGLLGLAALATRLADTLNHSIGFGAAGAVPAARTTIAGYAVMVVASNASRTAEAESTLAFQSQYQLTLQARSAEVDGVNIDEEMANMVLYQNAYSASARVIDSTTKMFDTLLSIGS